MEEKYIGDRIGKLRYKKGISARDMSLSLGQGGNYINQIENHKSLPSMKMFLYICEYLEVSPCEFFDEQNESPELITNINEKLKTLNDNQLKSILSFLNSFSS